MNSCNNILAGCGALLTSAGSGTICYHLIAATKDSIITRTADICEAVLSSSVLEKAKYAKPVLRFLLPRAMPLTEATIETICSVTIRLNTYSESFAIGAGLVSAGAFIYGISRFLTFKIKEE